MKAWYLGQYLPGDSWFHRADPLPKIVFTLLAVTFFFTAPVAAMASLLLFLVIFGPQAAGIARLHLLRGLRPFLWLLIFTVGINFLILFVGIGAVKLPPAEALQRAITTGGRIAGAVLATGFLTLSTSPLSIIERITSLLVPLLGARRGREGALLLGLTLNAVPVLLEKGDRQQKALLARGLTPGWRPRQLGLFLYYFLVPLLERTLDYSEELALALEARGYGCTEQREKEKKKVYSFSREDLVLWLVNCLLLSAVIFWRTGVGS